MRYYVYILQGKKDHKYYIGQTSDLEKRLAEHNRGKVHSTKHRMPLEVVYKEESMDRISAIRREKYFKSYKNTKDLLSHLSSRQTSINSSDNV